MKRGDLVTVAVSGNYGKPRPALVVQADAFDLHPSVIVLPLTSEIHDAPLFRVTVGAGKESGLRARSQIMEDKATNGAAGQDRTADGARKRGNDAGCERGAAGVFGDGARGAIEVIAFALPVSRNRELRRSGGFFFAAELHRGRLFSYSSHSAS